MGEQTAARGAPIWGRQLGSNQKLGSFSSDPKHLSEHLTPNDPALNVRLLFATLSPVYVGVMTSPVIRWPNGLCHYTLHIADWLTLSIMTQTNQLL